MHWIKWLMEGWVLLGIATTILGVFWTNRQSAESSKQTTISIAPPTLRRELTPANLSEAQSA